METESPRVTSLEARRFQSEGEGDDETTEVIESDLQSSSGGAVPTSGFISY